MARPLQRAPARRVLLRRRREGAACPSSQARIASRIIADAERS